MTNYPNPGTWPQSRPQASWCREPASGSRFPAGTRTQRDLQATEHRRESKISVPERRLTQGCDLSNNHPLWFLGWWWAHRPKLPGNPVSLSFLLVTVSHIFPAQTSQTTHLPHFLLPTTELSKQKQEQSDSYPRSLPPAHLPTSVATHARPNSTPTQAQDLPLSPLGPSSGNCPLSTGLITISIESCCCPYKPFPFFNWVVLTCYVHFCESASSCALRIHAL